MKATINFTVELDGYNTSTTMNMENVEDHTQKEMPILADLFSTIEKSISYGLTKYREGLVAAGIPPMLNDKPSEQ